MLALFIHFLNVHFLLLNYILQYKSATQRKFNRLAKPRLQKIKLHFSSGINFQCFIQTIHRRVDSIKV